MRLCVSFRAVFVSLLFAPGALLFLSSSVQASTTYHYYDPAPVGTLHVRQPVITWKVWPGSGLRITGVSLVVNGKTVPGA